MNDNTVEGMEKEILRNIVDTNESLVNNRDKECYWLFQRRAKGRSGELI